MINKFTLIIIISAIPIMPMQIWPWIPEEYPNTNQRNHSFTLLEAIEIGFSAEVEKLLKNGADPNQTYSYTFFEGRRSEFNGFRNPNPRSTTFTSNVLIRAATAGRKSASLVRLLLKYGARHDLKNSEGKTALEEVEGKIHVYKLLQGYENSVQDLEAVACILEAIDIGKNSVTQKIP